MHIEQFGTKDRRRLRSFVDFHWTLYRDHPNFVPKLDMELLGSRLFGEVGLLTEAHPFHKHADVTYFLAYKDNKVVGRVAGCVDYRYNTQQKEQDAIFGFFECVDDYEVAKGLLDSVATWGRRQGMKRLLGPMSFSTNHTIGFQVDAFDTLPYFETAYNPPYYPAMMDKYGMTKAMDVIAQMMVIDGAAEFQAGFERFKKEAAEAIARDEYTFRSINLKDKEHEVPLLQEVYNAAWGDNWGAVGLTDEEFHLVADQMGIACDPETALLAFVGEEPVALFIIMPDISDCIRKKYGFLDRWDSVRLLRLLWNRKKTDRARVILLGIKERYRQNGLRPLLVSQGIERVLAKKQYRYLEAGWLLETNSRIIRTGETFAAKRYKTWRVYQKPFEA